MKSARSTAVIAVIATVGTAVIAAGVWLCSPVAEPALERGDPKAGAAFESIPNAGERVARAVVLPDSSVPEMLANPKSEEELFREAQIARRLAELDHELQAASATTDSPNRSETLARLCFHWAEHDPRGAVARARALHLEENGVLENLTQQWAAADMRAAREWVNGLPSSDAKGRLAARIAFLLAQTAPESAANYILDAMPAGESQTEAAIAVVHQWAQRDRLAAAAWAQQFPAGELRDRALREISPSVPGSLQPPN